MWTLRLSPHSWIRSQKTSFKSKWHKDDDVTCGWRGEAECFSTVRNCIKDAYLKIDKVYDEKAEASLFSSPDGVYELYVSYGIMYGIIYVEAETADAKREEVKKEPAQEYEKYKETNRRIYKCIL